MPERSDQAIWLIGFIHGVLHRHELVVEAEGELPLHTALVVKYPRGQMVRITVEDV